MITKRETEIVNLELVVAKAEVERAAEKDRELTAAIEAVHQGVVKAEAVQAEVRRLTQPESETEAAERIWRVKQFRVRVFMASIQAFICFCLSITASF